MTRHDLTHHCQAHSIDYTAILQSLAWMNQQLISEYLNHGLLLEASQLKNIENELLSLELKQSQLAPRQQQEEGVTHFTWRTMEDDKVRATHAVLDGQVFSWEYCDIYPGEEYNCRCIAEPTLKDTDVTQKASSNINDSSSAWINYDYLGWFLYGKGADVTLSETGHLQDVINVAEQEVYANASSQIMGAAIEAFKNGDNEFTYDFHRSYHFSSVEWVFGDGVVSGDFKGDVKVVDDKLFVNGIVDYKYSDEFTDPLSIRQNRHIIGTSSSEAAPDWFVNLTDFTGDHYKITDEWQTNFNGSALLLNNK